jgi:hypothetical protein
MACEDTNHATGNDGKMVVFYSCLINNLNPYQQNCTSFPRKRNVIIKTLHYNYEIPNQVGNDDEAVVFYSCPINNLILINKTARLSREERKCKAFIKAMEKILRTN